MSVPAETNAFGGVVGDDAAFASLMDVLAPEEDQTPVEEGGAEAPASAGDAGLPAAPGEVPGGAGAAADAAAPGDAGQPGVPAGSEGGAPAADQLGATGTGTIGVGTVDHKAIVADFGKMSTALEDNTLKVHQEAVLAEAKTEFANYFEALTKHPRLLVGTEVPALGREGMETIRDTKDAEEWQGAVKSLLAEEIQARAQDRMEESRASLQTLHSSIELFQNNADLVPGTKTFDKDLADEFIRIVKPYELRVGGKLQGFSIPVQPLVNQLRSQLAASRAVKAQQQAAQPPAQPQAQAPAAKPAAPAHAPQAGIKSKAGASAGESENFDALFGTIGLSGIRL